MTTDCSFVRHRDGGIYDVLCTSTSTVDLSEHVVYVHVWPFETKTWHRPLTEWTEDRFTPISSEEVTALMQTDREIVQPEITARKNARKSLRDGERLDKGTNYQENIQ